MGELAMMTSNANMPLNLIDSIDLDAVKKTMVKINTMQKIFVLR